MEFTLDEIVEALNKDQVISTHTDPVKCLLAMAKAFREKGWNSTATIFITKALCLYKLECDPSSLLGDVLTKNPIILCLYEELSISSYYTHIKPLGNKISDYLMMTLSADNINKNMIHVNQYFYINSLPIIGRNRISVDMPYVNESIGTDRYRPMNPSIISSLQGEGYIALCRGVNYKQRNAVHFESLDRDGKIRTRNFLVYLNESFTIDRQIEIIDKSDIPRYQANVLGLEDCHLFRGDNKDQLWITCTTADTNPLRTPQISMGQLDISEDVAEVNNLTPLRGPDPNRCEKNWLPFIGKEGNTLFIYNYDPLTIKRIDHIGSGTTTRNYLEKSTYLDFSRFRGSAGPTPYEGGHLLIVHEVIFRDEGRNYFHRFLWLNDQYEISKISLLWYFDHKGIEFCKSIFLKDDTFIMGVGIEDSEAWIYQVSKDVVDSMLVPISEYWH